MKLGLTYARCLVIALSLSGGSALAQDQAMRHMTTDRVFAVHHAHQRIDQHHSHMGAMMHADRMMTPGGPLHASVERMNSLGGRTLVRRGEVLAVNLSPRARTALQAKGFSVADDTVLMALNMRATQITLPPRMSVRRGLRRIRMIDTAGVYGPNALFQFSGSAPAFEPVAASGAINARAEHNLGPLIGLIDSGVDPELCAARGCGLQQAAFNKDDVLTARAHGTWVAAIAADHGAGTFIVADVVDAETGMADTLAIAAALDWMVAQDVAVINMSLAGPPHPLLEAAVQRATNAGHVIIAAIGNQGRHRPPQFPAAYGPVIGVTAVDEQNRIYRRANVGEGVDIAARGVDVPVVLSATEAAERVTGTSFAAPRVAARLSAEVPTPAPGSAQYAAWWLSAQAEDAGDPGHDPVFGAGILMGND